EGDGLRRPRTESVRLLAEALELTDAEQTLLIAAARADNSAVDVDPDVPRQLPADVPGFAGRAGPLGDLDRLLDRGTPSTVVLAGTPGVGKTALAVHWAH